MGMTERTREGFGSVRRLPNGRYQARYTGPDGIRRTLGTFGQHRQARRALDRERLRIDDGLWTAPEAADDDALPTFAVFAEEWLAVRPKPLKPRTEAHYRDLLERLVLPTFGALPVDTITADQAEVWFYSLPRDRPTLRRHAYGLVRSIMKRAVRKYDLPRNPFEIEGATEKRRKVKPVVLTPAELDALAYAMPERLRLLPLLAAWCSLRFGEITELRRADIDLEAGRINVSRGVVRVKGGRIVDAPKTAAGIREVYLPPHLAPQVAEHLREHVGPGQDALLFPASNPDADGNEKHLAQSTLAKQFYKARDAIGQPTLRFHDLRHTGATYAAQTGATLAELMERLGHTTHQAALIYQHAARGRGAEIATALSDLAATKPQDKPAEADDLAAVLERLTPEDRERLRDLLDG